MSLRARLAKLATSVVVLTLVSTATILDPPLASAASITQGPRISGTTDVVASAGFTDTLTAPGFAGVTFANPTGGFTITNGDVLGTPGPLTVAGSPYTVTGTDSDTNGDVDTWTYTLTVTPDAIW